MVSCCDVNYSKNDNKLEYDKNLVNLLSYNSPPNHLLNTSKFNIFLLLDVFWKLHSNDFIKVEPFELHFTKIFKTNKITKFIRLQNISHNVTSVNIIPPQSQNFTLKYKCPVSFLIFYI